MSGGQGLNNEKDSSGGIGTISSGQVLPGNTEGVVITDQSAIQVVKTENTENGQQGEEATQAEEPEEEKPGICGDPCHNFHFLCCAIFPPYMFVWMAICLKQEGDEMIYTEEEEKAIREREREEYFAERKREKEEKQRKKEEKKKAKEEKKRAKQEARGK
ncbi:uncharacterized protein [Amphiura filiformis]|uniref:uncharacterized protein isoform X2 n=1 Tax=Amphiura filiformis TaxID=82378 RepID=UPI003B20FA09